MWTNKGLTLGSGSGMNNLDVWSRDVAEYPQPSSQQPQPVTDLGKQPQSSIVQSHGLTYQTASFRTKHGSTRCESVNRNFTAELLHKRWFADPAPESTLIGLQAGISPESFFEEGFFLVQCPARRFFRGQQGSTECLHQNTECYLAPSGNDVFQEILGMRNWFSFCFCFADHQMICSQTITRTPIRKSFRQFTIRIVRQLRSAKS